MTFAKRPKRGLSSSQASLPDILLGKRKAQSGGEAHISMCGIGGILSKGTQDVPPQALERMSAALQHRGPDDSGTYLSPDRKMGLVHRRLSIIDLSPEARQPMADSSGKIKIVLNGEIYNYKQLRAKLADKGYPFRTSSDTEVILASCQARTDDFLTALRGMFAFALWNEERKSLFLARDRMGIKPLYYADTGNFFVFASEIRCVLATGLVRKDISPEALSGYLSFGSIPAPLTILEDVKSLEPAAFIRIENGTITKKTYWKFDFELRRICPLRDEIHEMCKDAVSSHLVSDVPVGVFLSGGVDSSIITSLMRSVSSAEIRSFSITFPGSTLDEAPYARMAAQAFGTRHIDKPVTVDDFKRLLPSIAAAMDQPTIDGVNTFFVSQLAREANVKVILSGLGGDELFAGYPSFRIVPRLMRARAFVEKVPFGMKAVQGLLDCVPHTRRTHSLSEFFANGGSLEAGYFAVRSLFLDKEKTRLISPGVQAIKIKNFAPLGYLHGLVANGKTFDPVNATHLFEMRAYLHNQLLRDTDVMAMNHSVEVRVPFLDHLLVERVFQFPAEMRFGATPKDLLLSGFLKELPEPIYKRKKIGFSFPLDTWLRGDARSLLDNFFAGDPHEQIQEFLNWPEMVNVWNGFLDGHAHWSKPWSLYVLNEWMERNL